MAEISERELRRMNRERKKLQEERTKIMEDIVRQREEYIQSQTQKRVTVNAQEGSDQDKRGIDSTYQDFSREDLDLARKPTRESPRDALKLTPQGAEADVFDFATAMESYGREESLLTVDEHYSDSEEEVFDRLSSKGTPKERLDPRVIERTDIEKWRGQRERELSRLSFKEFQTEDTMPLKFQEPGLPQPRLNNQGKLD